MEELRGRKKKRKRGFRSAQVEERATLQAWTCADLEPASHSPKQAKGWPAHTFSPLPWCLEGAYYLFPLLPALYL